MCSKFHYSNMGVHLSLFLFSKKKMVQLKPEFANVDIQSESQEPVTVEAAQEVAGLLACIGALSFLGAAAFGGAMVAGKKELLEEMRSGKKEAFGGQCAAA